MQARRWQRSRRAAGGTRVLDLALVVTGGVLYASGVPPHDCAVSPWVALVPLLAVAARATAAGAFAAGVVYGLVFYAAIVGWVVEAVRAYFATGLAGALAFSAAIGILFVALYVGTFAVAARRLLAYDRWLGLLAIPALWVAYELARATLLTGLPWELLGHSQWQRIGLIQIADLGGVYAVSYLVAAVNVGIYLALRTLARPALPRRLVPALGPLAVALLLIVAALGYGQWRLAGVAATPAGEPRLLTLVQGNQPSRLDWGRAQAERDLLLYAGLSRQALTQTVPDLLVWPEYAVSLYPAGDVTVLPALASLADTTRAGLVFGAPRQDGTPTRYYNAAYHLPPRGTLASYDKVKLVPFAEYQPLAVAEASAAEGDSRTFHAGGPPTIFETASGRLGTLICYEVIFPELTRDLVRRGAEVLLNLSNDGWLDRAGLGAGAQHLSMAVFRAIETRRYLARASASGISGFVDPVGRPFALLPVGARGVTTGEVRPRRGLTLYVRIGDAFALACVLFGLGGWWRATRVRRRA